MYETYYDQRDVFVVCKTDSVDGNNQYGLHFKRLKKKKIILSYQLMHEKSIWQNPTLTHVAIFHQVKRRGITLNS